MMMSGLYLPGGSMMIIPLLIAAALSAWASSNVNSTYAKFGRVRARRGVTAHQVAQLLLSNFGMGAMPINHVAGNLTDHYDPSRHTLNLSDSVDNSPSIAAIGVAAHEVGHAIQHQQAYAPLTFRNNICPVVNLASNAAMPLFVLGMIMSSGGLMTIGIVFFSGAVLFHLITLPVEFDASNRALKLLAQTGTLDQDELAGARKVLRAAALTYVAAALTAVLQLIRLLLIKRSNDRRR